MEFINGSTYTRNDIHAMYFGGPVPKTGTGLWTTGYVGIEDELIVFMNMGVPGRTGHDFPNSYDEETNTVEWFGKPNTNSRQPTFTRLINGELIPHFFARWDNGDPFTYLGVGKFVSYQDGIPTVTSKGDPAETINMTWTFEDSESIFQPDDEKHDGFLEGFIESLDGKISSLSKEEVLAQAKAFDNSLSPSHGIQNGKNRVRRENQTQKRRVAYLEDYTCQVCGFKNSYTKKNGENGWIITIDHILQKSDGGNENIDNLWALCPNCHAKKTYGVIEINLKKKEVYENGGKISIRDNHLFIASTTN